MQSRSRLLLFRWLPVVASVWLLTVLPLIVQAQAVLRPRDSTPSVNFFNNPIGTNPATNENENSDDGPGTDSTSSSSGTPPPLQLVAVNSKMGSIRKGSGSFLRRPPTGASNPGIDDTGTDGSSGTSIPAPPLNPPVTSRSTYTMTSEVFNATVPTFSSDMLEPYESTGDLEADLVQVLKVYTTGVIKRQSSSYYYFPGAPEGVQLAPVSTGGLSVTSAAVNSNSAEGVTDFETNNQESGVDESDFTKSDGTYVYTAYGDSIVVWDALSGDLLSNVTLPVPDASSGYGGSGSGGGTFTTSLYYGPPSARVRGLLLDGTRLTAIVSGYNSDGGRVRPLPGQEPPSPAALSSTIATRIIVYTTEWIAATGQLRELYQQDIDGAFHDARAIGSKVHIVTTASILLYSRLESSLARWNAEFGDLTDEEYADAARTLAEDELIPALARDIVAEIAEDGSTDNIAGVGLWQSVLSGDSFEDSMYYDRPLIDSYVRVSSFDMQLEEGQEDLGISVSGSFMPTGLGYTYATADMIIFSANGWDWSNEQGGFADTTYLIGFSMDADGTSTTPAAIGSLPGQILNQYSLDIYDGHLRVATTIRSVFSPPTNGAIGILPVTPRTENQVIILTIPSLTVDGEPGVFSEVSRISNLGKPGEVFTTVRFFDNIAYAVTFERTDPFYSLNLDPASPSVLGELSITGFSSYLHSMNANNTKLIAVGQEADENGVVLGIQLTVFNATDPANMTNSSRYLVEIDRDVWLSSSVSWDYKAFRYLDLGDDDGIVILPLRISGSRFAENNNDFDGFIVLEVRDDIITPKFNITHSSGLDSWYGGCYHNRELVDRSLVFDGKVTTMRGYKVVSTDLETGEQAWQLELTSTGDDCLYV